MASEEKITQIIIHVILFLSQNKYECRYELGNWTKLTWNTKLYNNNQKISNMLQLPYTFNFICSSFISETVKITHDTYIFYEHNISNFKKMWNIYPSQLKCLSSPLLDKLYYASCCHFNISLWRLLFLTNSPLRPVHYLQQHNSWKFIKWPNLQHHGIIWEANEEVLAFLL